MTKNKRIKAQASLAPARTERRLFLWSAIGLLAVASMAGVYYFLTDRSRIPSFASTNLAQVEMGKRIYAQACASCHGVSLEGQPNWQKRLPNGRMPAPPHDVSGHTWHHADDVLFRITKYGPGAYPAGHQTDMPAFQELLSDQEIAASLAFIKSKWPLEIQTRQSRMNAEPGRPRR